MKAPARLIYRADTVEYWRDRSPPLNLGEKEFLLFNHFLKYIIPVGRKISVEMMARTRSFHLPHSHRSLIEDTKFSYRQIRSSEPKTFFPSRDACKSIPARNSGQPFLWGERILYSAWPANFAGCNFEGTIRPENRSPREGYIIIIIKVWLITILKLWRYEENSGWPIIAGPSKDSL